MNDSRERAAIYPGTFDPVTLGHVDVITRGSRLFDRLVVAVARNHGKTPLFPVQQRLDFLRQSVGHLPGVSVEQFDGLLVDYAKRQGFRVILRGLRAISDFETEFQMAAMNHKLEEDVETVFLMAGESTTFLSSRLIKEIASMGGDVSAFVPAAVIPALAARLADRQGA